MLTFILSLIAGFATPMVEPFVAGIMRPLTKDVPLVEGEFRTITFVLLMLAVAVVALTSGHHSATFSILLGGVLGLFGMRIFNAVMALVSARQAAPAEKNDDASE